MDSHFMRHIRPHKIKFNTHIFRIWWMGVETSDAMHILHPPVNTFNGLTGMFDEREEGGSTMEMEG